MPFSIPLAKDIEFLNNLNPNQNSFDQQNDQYFPLKKRSFLKNLWCRFIHLITFTLVPENGALDNLTKNIMRRLSKEFHEKKEWTEEEKKSVALSLKVLERVNKNNGGSKTKKLKKLLHQVEHIEIISKRHFKEETIESLKSSTKIQEVLIANKVDKNFNEIKTEKPVVQIEAVNQTLLPLAEKKPEERVTDINTQPSIEPIPLLKPTEESQISSEQILPVNHVQHALDQCKSIIENEVMALLHQKLYGDFPHFIHTPGNEEKIMQLVSSSSVFLGKMTKELFTKFVKCKEKAEEFQRQENSSSDEVIKNDYNLHKYSYEILKLYTNALIKLMFRICSVDNQTLEITEEDNSFESILIAQIMEIVKIRTESLNIDKSERAEVNQIILTSILDLIKENYSKELDKLSSGILASATTNLKNLPCEIKTFQDLTTKFEKNLFENRLNSIHDPRRILQTQSIDFYVKAENEQATIVNIGHSSDIIWYMFMLDYFSRHLFGYEEVFSFFTKLIVQKMQIKFNENSDLSNAIFFQNFEKCYRKVEELREIEINELEIIFQEKFYSFPLEKIIKYFKVCHILLNQSFIYFITMALCSIRAEKLNEGKRGIQRVPQGKELNKIEVIFLEDTPHIEFQFSRRDALIHQDVIFSTNYSFVLNTSNGEVQFPKSLKMKIDCPENLIFENDQIMDMIIDLPLIAKSLNFPSKVEVEFVNGNAYSTPI